jgi:hypothetical protein
LSSPLDLPLPHSRYLLPELLPMKTAHSPLLQSESLLQELQWPFLPEQPRIDRHRTAVTTTSPFMSQFRVVTQTSMSQVP